MIEVIISVSSVVCVFVVFLLGLLLKRLSELDAKLDRHIEASTQFRTDLTVLQDRWERK